MSEEEKQLLESLADKVEENNKILRSMRSSQRMKSLTRFLYWIIIIAMGIYSWYLLQPVFSSLISVYQSVSAIGSSGKEGIRKANESLEKIQDLQNNTAVKKAMQLLGQ